MDKKDDSKLQFDMETQPMEPNETESKEIQKNDKVMDKIKTVMTVAEDEEPIQVLKSDNLEEEY